MPLEEGKEEEGMEALHHMFWVALWFSVGFTFNQGHSVLYHWNIHNSCTLTLQHVYYRGCGFKGVSCQTADVTFWSKHLIYAPDPLLSWSLKFWKIRCSYAAHACTALYASACWCERSLWVHTFLTNDNAPDKVCKWVWISTIWKNTGTHMWVINCSYNAEQNYSYALCLSVYLIQASWDSWFLWRPMWVEVVGTHERPLTRTGSAILTNQLWFTVVTLCGCTERWAWTQILIRIPCVDSSSCSNVSVGHAWVQILLNLELTDL